MPSILIAEDSREFAEILNALLSEQGYTLAGIVSTGAEAVDLVRKTSPDLVLLDIRLEGPMDGIAAASEIRAFSAVPIIFMTGYSDKETLDEAMLLKPQGYLAKPFLCDQLVRAVEKALAPVT